ncbi:pirin family protein [Variovorax terrae]|uniref:Pirin family protein n=1 Tax=Variovorax terrae TaxID=2923278 RepID=A0A9X2ARX2_9BURK|nr:pirin family protein [Variovorax terrae]MCJ0765967.1 pirin family protein [Variovorax terrae]
MSQRPIETALPEDRVIDDGDMLLRRALPVERRPSLGPFVFLDHYRHHSQRGIGDKPHPHAGIEVISYLLDGGVEHRDSAGFRDRLGPGDAQWIRAGRGMLHAEQPIGGRHGLQLWTSLPPAMKFAEPDYASFRAADIPEIRLPGASVRVIAGTVDGVTGPMKNATPTVFAHALLDPGARIALDVQAEELGCYVLEGAIEGPDGEALGPGTLALFGPGTQAVVQAAEGQSASVAVLGGAPVEGELIFDGPFVMDTPERIVQAKRDFLGGKMGRLDGVPY